MPASELNELLAGSSENMPWDDADLFGLGMFQSFISRYDVAEVVTAEASHCREGRVSSLLPDPLQMFSFLGPFTQAAMLANKLLRNVSAGQRLPVSLDFVDGSETRFAIECCRWFGLEDEDRGLPKTLSGTDLASCDRI
jgi:hypothetical protein